MLMRTEVIYSIAALATFPVVANAQVDVNTIAKVQLTGGEVSQVINYKDGNATKQLDKGKYIITSDAITGTANASIKVAVKNGENVLPLNGAAAAEPVTVSVGSQINVTFELGTAVLPEGGLTLEITNGEGVTEVKNVKVTLDLKVDKIYNTLLGEYSTNYINALYNNAEYKDKDQQIDLRNKIVALATYKYTDYVRKAMEPTAFMLSLVMKTTQQKCSVFQN